ncbi:unnamed protein product [Caretta caretta]
MKRKGDKENKAFPLPKIGTREREREATIILASICRCHTAQMLCWPCISQTRCYADNPSPAFVFTVHTFPTKLFEVSVSIAQRPDFFFHCGASCMSTVTMM